jgi:dTDP-4-dehydrorhamnose 3,5-epimerase
VIFSPTRLEGAHVIELERREDDRGFFARAWCQKEFAERGLSTDLVQANVAWSERKGTLRGLHFQKPPHAETKVVRCTRGALFDVIVDLRPGSPTQLHWLGVELTADNRKMLYVPEGFAHGYQTLEDDTEAFYHVSAFYAPEAEWGVRWNDPAFGIEWPHPDGALLSEKDRTWPDYAA